MWARLQGTSFLTDDEKRAAIGYGPMPVETPTAVADFDTPEADDEKYNRYHDEIGQFTNAEGAVGGASGAGALSEEGNAAPSRSGAQYADAGYDINSSGTTEDTSPEVEDARSRYRPGGPGWHGYDVENTVCPAELKCTEVEMKDWLSRYTVPGQDPSRPFVNGETTLVRHPITGTPAGWVKTYGSRDGLSATNITTRNHIFYDGMATRKVKRNADGSWSVATRGIGNNVRPMHLLNRYLGPSIFETMDMRMRTSIERSRRANKKSLDRATLPSGSGGSFDMGSSLSGEEYGE